MKSVPILCYHRVCPVSEIGVDSRSLCVTPEQFTWQMRFLSIAGYKPVSLQDLTGAILGAKNIPRRSVLITFDDGYQDNYIHAYPVLKRHSFTATVYMVTDFIGGKNVWDSGSVPLLNDTQIEEMNLGGVVFGSHTASHIDMSRKEADVIRTELLRSKKRIEDITRRLDTSFCYPYSRLNEHSKELVKETGYSCAVTGDEGPLDMAEDIYELRRVQVFPSTNLFQFWVKLQPWYASYRRRLRR